MSDVPYSGFKFFYPKEKFLSTHQQYPPKPLDLLYIILETWRVIFEAEEEEHYLWCQRRMLQDGKTFKWVHDHLFDIVSDQNKILETGTKLSSKEDLQIKEYAGFALYPTKEWVRVRLGR